MTASIAQKMLQRHEELVSVLPPDIKALIPRLNDFAGLDMASTVGSPPSGRRSRETTGSSASSYNLKSPREDTPAVLNPMLKFASPNFQDDQFELSDMPSHRRSRSAYVHNNARDTFAEVQQQEADERLAAMEQALAEAKESEEAQRKVAARLRRDFEKLQRDYERAEAQAIKENRDSISSTGAMFMGTTATPTRKPKTPSSRNGSVSVYTRILERSTDFLSLVVHPPLRRVVVRRSG